MAEGRIREKQSIKEKNSHVGLCSKNVLGSSKVSLPYFNQSIKSSHIIATFCDTTRLLIAFDYARPSLPLCLR